MTSVDKMVVLVALSGPGAVHHARDTCRRIRTQPPPEAEEQGVAQLLAQDNEILVCSYLPAGGWPVLTQLNESPHAHDPVALGLSMVKPCFSMVSTKSIVAPCT